MISRFVAGAARLAYRPSMAVQWLVCLVTNNIGDFYLYWMRLRNL